LDIPDNILLLKELVRVLYDKISVLEARIAELETEKVVLLETENATLKTEIVELKARLGLDSHNSSKPPSTDGLRKKPAFPREKNRKQGGQENHDGKTLEMSENPDFIVECKVEKCTCGHDLSQEPTRILACRQEFDLPEPRLEITEFRVLQTVCPHCGQIHKGQFPEGINAPTQYGHRVNAFTTLVTNQCKLSLEMAQTLFFDIYGYCINEGTIQTANETCHEILEPTEQIIQDKIIESPTVNNDETGIRCQGKLHWLHVAATALYTYLFVHAKRGKEAIESQKSILKRFFGWSVHDCWSSYFNLTNIKHALCGAHILRELQAQIDIKSQWAFDFKTYLLKTFHTPIEERLINRTITREILITELKRLN